MWRIAAMPSTGGTSRAPWIALTAFNTPATLILSAALLAGSELPAPPIPAPADSAPLARAMATCRAIEAAARDLGAEAAAARDKAATAARACRSLVDSILAADARAIAGEWVAAVRLGWELQDRLTGLARMGDGAFLPSDQQAEILAQIDRPKSAIAANALMIENGHFNRYLDNLAAEQEKRWLDYGRRLMNDAASTFDGDAISQ
jgi:hypothetical protein